MMRYNELSRKGFSALWAGLDLNRAGSMLALAEPSHEHRKTRLCSTHDAPSLDHVSAVRRQLWRGTQGQAVHLHGSIPVYGLCPTDLPGKSARHRSLSAQPVGLDLSETVYALDATTIDLCLSVFPWAPFRTTKAAVKLHPILSGFYRFKDTQKKLSKSLSGRY